MNKDVWKDVLITKLPQEINTISRRDYFAAHALIGLSTKVIINGRSNPSYESQIANDCVFLADALISELDKKENKE